MISLIHPSRGRPGKAYDVATKWLEQAGTTNIEYVLSIDEDDPYAHHYTVDNLPAIHAVMTKNPNSCVVEATNHGAAKSVGDLLLYLSDDFDCFPNWGKTLEQIAARYQGGFMIKADDGLQRFEAQVLTIPIMSRPLYQRLGYFFHPDYKSMWVDVDLFYTCDRLGAIKNHPEIKFQHNHYSIGKSKKDATNERSDAFWNQGKEILHRRKVAGFRA